MNRAKHACAASLLCLTLFGSALAAAPQAASKNTAATSAPAPPSSDENTINGIAIMPGVERLSYISPRYYGIRPSYDACLKTTQGQVALQGDCADAEFGYQDARLNKAYKALLAAITAAEGKDAVKDVQEAQRAWLTYYSKDCAVRSHRFGSDAGPSSLSICRMEQTAIRAQELEDWRSSYMASHPR